MRIVAGDVGGTHARFAIAEVAASGTPALGQVRKYRIAEHGGLASAWAAFKRDSGGELPRQAAVGVAAPMDGDVLRFVNSGWMIDRRTIAAELGIEKLSLLNDFGAVAHAVSAMAPDTFAPLAGPPAGLPEDGVVTVIGPGTGLGVAALLRRGGRAEVIETEAAHIAFAPDTEGERLVEQAVRASHGRCSVERVVSGPGLSDIYDTLGGPKFHDPARLWAAALEGGDPAAGRALDLLVGAFGAAAGDLSLAHGSMTLVIAGGLANRMRDRLASPIFRDRFVAKGRYRARMERVPVLLSTHPEPGLLGAAVAFQRRLAAS